MCFATGSSLQKQLSKAVAMFAKHRALANKWTAQFEPATVKKWEKMISDWDADTTKPCPYEEEQISKVIYSTDLSIC
jgi:hypothetical protein